MGNRRTKLLLGVSCVLLVAGCVMFATPPTTLAFEVIEDDPCPKGCENTDAAVNPAQGSCSSPAPMQQCIESVYGTMDAGACTHGWSYSINHCTSTNLLGCCVLLSDAGLPAVANCYYQLPNQSRSAEPIYRNICGVLHGNWQSTVP